VSCFDLDDPIPGYVEYDSNIDIDSMQYPNGTIATYVCEEGYVLNLKNSNGTRTRRCVKNTDLLGIETGIWDGEASNCTSMRFIN